MAQQSKSSTPFHLKRFKIDRNQRWSMVAIVVIVVSIVFTAYWATNRISLIDYREVAIKELEKNTADLEAKKAIINQFESSHEEFKSDDKYVLDSSIRGEGVNNSVLVARALPTHYDKKQLSGALRDYFVNDREYQVTFSLPEDSFGESGSTLGAEAGRRFPETQTEMSKQAQEFFKEVRVVSFSISLESIPYTCNTEDESERCIKTFFKDLDRFITPIRVKSVSLKVLDQEVPRENQLVGLDLLVEIYLLPKQNVITKETKTVEDKKAEEEKKKKAEEEKKKKAEEEEKN